MMQQPPTVSFDHTASNVGDDEDESVLPLEEQTQRPNDVAVQQQRIEAWSPILDPDWVIYSFLILALIFIPVGEYFYLNLPYTLLCLNDSTSNVDLIDLLRLQNAELVGQCRRNAPDL